MKTVFPIGFELVGGPGWVGRLVGGFGVGDRRGGGKALRMKVNQVTYQTVGS
jgi:hypothetical protein